MSYNLLDSDVTYKIQYTEEKYYDHMEATQARIAQEPKV